MGTLGLAIARGAPPTMQECLDPRISTTRLLFFCAHKKGSSNFDLLAFSCSILSEIERAVLLSQKKSSGSLYLTPCITYIYTVYISAFKATPYHALPHHSSNSSAVTGGEWKGISPISFPEQETAPHAYRRTTIQVVCFLTPTATRTKAGVTLDATEWRYIEMYLCAQPQRTVPNCNA